MPACNAGDPGSIPVSDPWVGKIPWRRKWQPTPIFFPGEFHGQRSLAGYSLWGGKESDTTERLKKKGGAGGNKLAIFFPLYKFKKRFLLKFYVAIMTPGFT